jgi:hypothetical protein
MSPREKLIVKNKNQNALIEQDTLKSLESENGKMSSSFIHVDMDEKLVSLLKPQHQTYFQR